MSLLDVLTRRGLFGFALAAATGLAGCGFQPVYNNAGGTYGGAADIAAIEIAPMADRAGQQLRNALIRLITPSGQPTNPTHKMSLAMSVSGQDALVREDTNVDRKWVIMKVSYKITAVESTKPVIESTAYAQASYNRVESEFANIRALEDAENRLAREVAEQIRAHLAARLFTPT
ncbi:MAG: LPS assembly lipoprotein LptE [Alphaproteobacteria bacterium]